ncbi:hypothetical protein [Colwellia sp. TT2012]|uniref:hypothetical protein n=1 Tax=Colwellia sp. TT2012 TaxID=1720342 RepID=UPI00070A73CE|nr:hypothetical protein [Colwellia sp. TT2012]
MNTKKIVAINIVIILACITSYFRTVAPRLFTEEVVDSMLVIDEKIQVAIDNKDIENIEDSLKIKYAQIKYLRTMDENKISYLIINIILILISSVYTIVLVIRSSNHQKHNKKINKDT